MHVCLNEYQTGTVDSRMHTCNVKMHDVWVHVATTDLEYKDIATLGVREVFISVIFSY